MRTDKLETVIPRETGSIVQVSAFHRLGTLNTRKPLFAFELVELKMANVDLKFVMVVYFEIRSFIYFPLLNMKSL